jgi:hypothetical protein
VRAPALAALPVALMACAQALGGLEEGSARSLSGANDAGAERACRSDWLPGFAYRVAFEATSSEPATVPGYSLEVAMSTAALVGTQKLRLDGADLRVTLADGVTLAPHWVQSGLGGESTRIWTKLDVTPGVNRFFVYYGNPGADDRASLRDAFIAGIIENAAFDQGSAPWVSLTQPADAPVTVMSIQAGAAQVGLARDRATAAARAAWCQATVFPEGRRYQLLFDANTTAINWGEAAVWVNGFDGPTSWTSPGLGATQNATTTAITPGPSQICFGVRLTPPSGVAPPDAVAEARFSSVRVRPWIGSTLIARPSGPEETRCAP